MKKLLREFRDFAMRGNVVDMAVGVIVGGAFGKIVTSLVSDMVMPVLGLLTGSIDVSGAFYALDGGSYPSAQAAADAGVGTINYGAFLQNVIDFLLIALCVFLMVKLLARLRRVRQPEPSREPPRLCPYCKGEIHAQATRCPHCTSMLDP